MHTHKPARRHFLKLSTRLATLGLTGLGFGPGRSWFVSDAAAAPVTDYKALVCVYLFGGNDCNNTIVPVDTARYTQYQTLRAGLTLSGSKLLSPIVDGSGNQYALHYGLPQIELALQPGQGRVRAQHRPARTAADAGASIRPACWRRATCSRTPIRRCRRRRRPPTRPSAAGAAGCSTRSA